MAAIWRHILTDDELETIVDEYARAEHVSYHSGGGGRPVWDGSCMREPQRAA